MVPDAAARPAGLRSSPARLAEPENVLARPAERAHGGVIASHALSADSLRYNVQNNCRLLAPSIGVELAAAVPPFGDIALVGGAATIRQFPSHGIRIFGTDIWSGTQGTAPREICPVPAAAPPVAFGEHNCTLQRALALRPFGQYGMGKVLEYWEHPVPGDGPCDAPADIARLWRANWDQAKRYFRVLGTRPDAPPARPADNPIIREVFQACENSRTKLLDPSCVERNLPRYAYHKGFVMALRDYIAEADEGAAGAEREEAYQRWLAAEDPASEEPPPGGRVGCHEPSVDEQIEFYERVNQFYGMVGLVHSPHYVIGSDLILPEEAIAQTARTKLVARTNLGDADWREQQNQIVDDVRGLVAGSGQCRAPADVPSPDPSCVEALTRRILAADSPAEIRLLLPGPQGALAGSLHERIQRHFRYTTSTYYEAKTNRAVPMGLFQRVYVPEGEARRVSYWLRPDPGAGPDPPDAAPAPAGCTISVRAYPERPDPERHDEWAAGGPALQAAVNEDHGLATPGPRQIAEVALPGQGTFLTGRYGYTANRVALVARAATDPGTTARFWEPADYVAVRGPEPLLDYLGSDALGGWWDLPQLHKSAPRLVEAVESDISRLVRKTYFSSPGPYPGEGNPPEPPTPAEQAVLDRPAVQAFLGEVDLTTPYYSPSRAGWGHLRRAAEQLVNAVHHGPAMGEWYFGPVTAGPAEEALALQALAALRTIPDPYVTYPAIYDAEADLVRPVSPEDAVASSSRVLQADDGQELASALAVPNRP